MVSLLVLVGGSEVVDGEGEELVGTEDDSVDVELTTVFVVKVVGSVLVVSDAVLVISEVTVVGVVVGRVDVSSVAEDTEAVFDAEAVPFVVCAANKAASFSSNTTCSSFAIATKAGECAARCAVRTPAVLVCR